MAFFKSKKTAVAVCILLVLISVLFGSHRSLNALRSEALDLYTNGDETGLSILANLNSIQEYTAALLKAAAPYYDKTNDAFAALSDAHEQLTDALGKGPTEQRQALSELLSACTALQLDYTDSDTVPADAAKSMTRSINDITSMKDQIRHSGYNAAAAAFNAVLETFPAGMLGGLTGIRALPPF